MTKTALRRMSAFALATAIPCVPAVGGVVGYWNFDTIADTTDAGGGEQFYEDAYNLHFTRPSASGTVLASSEVTTVGPANAFTLDIQATVMDTPSTDKFSIGRTGKLTVQFWYRPMLADTYRYILSQSGTNNAWSMYQTLPQPNGKAAIEFSAMTNGGATRSIVTPAD